MRIAICDDEERQLAYITAYTAEYIKKEHLDIRIKSFTSPRELLADEAKNGSSAIYLLDIVMDDINGLELARRIREYNKKALILYLTTSPECSLDAFSVHAFSYLVKPISKVQLFEELHNCFTYYLPPQKAEPVITVKTAEGFIPLLLDRINAVEYFDHRLIYHLTDHTRIEGLSSRERFDTQAAEIAALGVFAKCASSYFVNMENILSASPRSFRMKNGEAFPITRKYAAAKDIFLKYKFKEGD